MRKKCMHVYFSPLISSWKAENATQFTGKEKENGKF